MAPIKTLEVLSSKVHLLNKTSKNAVTECEVVSKYFITMTPYIERFFIIFLINFFIPRLKLIMKYVRLQIHFTVHSWEVCGGPFSRSGSAWDDFTSFWMMMYKMKLSEGFQTLDQIKKGLPGNELWMAMTRKKSLI